MKPVTVAIVGAGAVGSTIAYTLLMRTVASTIILVDSAQKKCSGEVLDLLDARIFSDVHDVRAGTLRDAGQADILIIAAGVPQKPGQSRSELLATNKVVVRSIIEGMGSFRSDLIIIVVTNPVDVLTFLVQKISGLPRSHIFGSGTLLDTDRLRRCVGESIDVDPRSVDLFVLGEHGESQFVAWSTATIAGMPLIEFPGFSRAACAQYADAARKRVYEIIECKGATAFGVAACVASYCVDVIFDTKRITPVSCYVEEYDLCMSMPAVIGARGIEKVIIPLLSEEERHQCAASVATLRADCEKI